MLRIGLTIRAFYFESCELNLHLDSCLQQLPALRLASKALISMACEVQDVITCLLCGSTIFSRSPKT